MAAWVRRFPHRWYRLLVVFSLFWLMLFYSIDSAVHHTICCSYEVFRWLDGLQGSLGVVSGVFGLLVVILPLLVPVLFGLTLRSWFKEREDFGRWLRDSIFGLVSLVNFDVLFALANGHGERSWGPAFRTDWILLLVLWLVALVTVKTDRRTTIVRACLYGAGLAASVVIPRYMVSSHSTQWVGDMLLREKYPLTTIYSFALVITSFFWLLELWMADSGKRHPTRTPA